MVLLEFLQPGGDTGPEKNSVKESEVLKL